MLTFERKPIKKHDLSTMNWIRKVCIKVTQHKSFEIVILIAIVVNTIIIGSHHFMISEEEEENLTILNICFLVFFLIEALIKIIAQ